MLDPYGIPDNMFGQVPESFYAIIGRVVMVSALLELRLLDLATDLAKAPQGEHAGKRGSELITECCHQLANYEDDYRDDASAVLNQARQALDSRHAIVHSLWPSPNTPSVFGWRPVRAKRSKHKGNPYEDITLNVYEMGDLIAKLVHLVHEVVRLRERAPLARPSG